MSLILMALVLGANPQATAPATAAPAKPAKPKVTCVEDVPLGSRLGGRRICHTAAEWDVLRRDNRDETERAQRINTIHGN